MFSLLLMTGVTTAVQEDIITMDLLLLQLLHHPNIQMFLCFSLFLLLLCQKFRMVQNPKLKLPPSPPKLPLIGHLHLFNNLPYRSLKQLSDTHGSLMLLQLGQIPTLVVSSAEAAREVLKTHDLSFADRFIPIAALKLSYGCSDVTFAPYGAYWRHVRKICILELLSTTRVRSYSTVREQEMDHMIHNISSRSSHVIDLSLVLQSLANNVLCRVAFGRNYNDDGVGKSSFIQLIEESVALMGGTSIGDFFPSIVWMSLLSGLEYRLKKNFKALDEFLEEIIKDHLDPTRVKLDHEDIVDVLLQVGKGSSPSLDVSLTRDHIKALLMDMYVAGSDTSSVTLEWAMTELVRNPRVMKKAQNEVRQMIVRQGKEKIEESDVGKLEYLNLVVKEVLRLHPPGPFLLPRVCREECKINGYDIPKKARVFVNVWAIGRDPRYWKDPEEFWPERFVDSSKDFKGHDFDFLPFGAGRRGCPGIHFATATIHLALAHLLYSFNWELPPGMTVEDLNMDESFSPVIRKKHTLRLVATPHPPLQQELYI